ncbi:Protein 21.1 [Giardia lamblia P15]|uniref:Protein 21.1 n=1 Tax=Giardia intestinalis (strain P15) TaxID=658858 RepID=E1F9U2_GIAIA|nr:Protein 21.1 [Giardia lamblia P15]
MHKIKMPSTDDSSQFLQEHNCAPPLAPEKDTSEEGAGKSSSTEPSQTDDEGSVDENGVTTLMKAAKRNDVEAVKRYIPYQARMVAKLVEVKGIEIHEGTALMVAAVLGHTEVVRLLMKYERGMKSSNEYTALMWGVANDHIEVARLLLKTEGGMHKGKSFTALVIATSFGYLECVRLLLENKKEKDIGGEPALRMAGIRGCSEIASLLEREGVRVIDPLLQALPRKPTSGLA